METKNYDEIEEIDVFAEDTPKETAVSRTKKNNKGGNLKDTSGTIRHLVKLNESAWVCLNMGQIALSEKRGKSISKEDFLSEAIECLLEKNCISLASYSKKFFKK